MKIKTLLAIATTLAGCTNTEAHPAWVYERLIDGDTLVFIAPELPSPLQKISVRVIGIDTPESTWRADCPAEQALGIEAKQYVQNLLDKRSTLEVIPVKWGKYGGRVLGQVLIDGQDLAERLKESGYGVFYDGGQKTDWCEILLKN